MLRMESQLCEKALTVPSNWEGNELCEGKRSLDRLNSIKVSCMLLIRVCLCVFERKTQITTAKKLLTTKMGGKKVW